MNTGAVHANVRRLLVHALGWTLIALGVVSSLVPVIPGFLLVLLGLSVLSMESTRAKRVHARLRNWIGQERVDRWNERFRRKRPADPEAVDDTTDPARSA